jgi:hypothetical protein
LEEAATFSASSSKVRVRGSMELAAMAVMPDSRVFRVAHKW